MTMKTFASLCVTLCSLCVEAAGESITTDAPGWVFRDTEQPVFRLDYSHKEPKGHKDFAHSASFAVEENLRVSVPPCETNTAWTIRDWRGRELARGEWPADGRLALEPLLPGYYWLSWERGHPARGAAGGRTSWGRGHLACG